MSHTTLPVGAAPGTSSAGTCTAGTCTDGTCTDGTCTAGTCTDGTSSAGSCNHGGETRRAADRYVAPGRGTAVSNRVMMSLTRLGLPTRGAVILTVVMRESKGRQRVPVNLLELDGVRYLVAPRGCTDWVRNLRAAEGRGAYQRGRVVTEFQCVEVADTDKAPILAAYLQRWSKETARFFKPLTADSPGMEFDRLAHAFPVFRLLS